MDPRESGLPEGAPPKPLGFLAWIAAYKLIKATLAVTGAVVVMRLGHQNLVHVARHLLQRLRFDPEGWVGTRLLARVGHFDPRHVQFAGQLLFVYAILYCIEAVGLFLEKRWAEWLTVVQTALLIPVEIFEMWRKPGPFKLVALLASLTVVLYLIWRIRRDILDEEEERAIHAVAHDVPPLDRAS